MRTRFSGTTRSRRRSTRGPEEAPAVLDYGPVVVLVAPATVAMPAASWASAVGIQSGTEAL